LSPRRPGAEKNLGVLDATTKNQQNERAGEGGERGRTGGGPGKANDPFLLPSPRFWLLKGCSRGSRIGI